MDAPFVDPNRDADTFVEVRVQNRDEALGKFRELQTEHPICWVEVGTLREFFQIEDQLKELPADQSIFLYLSLPSHYDSWDLVKEGMMIALDEVLFRLWPEEMKLYLVHHGPQLVIFECRSADNDAEGTVGSAQ